MHFWLPLSAAAICLWSSLTPPRPPATPEVPIFLGGAAFSCEGCSATQVTFGTGAAPGVGVEIVVTNGFAITSGTCILRSDGSDGCDPSACQSPGGKVTFENVYGVTLFYSFPPSATRTPLPDGWEISPTFQVGPVSCDEETGQQLIQFWDAETDGSVVASWGAECSACPASAGADD